jgi:acyl-CoA dehydrogenase
MTETAAILARMVDGLLTDHVDHKLLVAAEQGGWAKDLWALAESQGLTLALVPEDRGGIGASFQDAFVIVRACGQHRAPLPLPETIAAAWLLTSAGLDVPAGPLSLCGAGPRDQLRLERGPAGWRLSGTARRVPWGRSVEAVALPVTYGGATMIVRAQRAGCAVEAGANLAGECRDTLIYRDHPVDAAPWPQGWLPDPVAVIGAMMRSGQIAGALSDILGRSVTYANDRCQFGRPIGKQQAIQQSLALLAAEAAAVEVAAEAAFLAADRGDAGFLTAVAKVRSGIAVSQAVGIAHQVHGAIGFTLEHPLHWSTRRLMSWRTEFGSDRHWAVILGRQVLELGSGGFWPQVTAN